MRNQCALMCLVSLLALSSMSYSDGLPTNSSNGSDPANPPSFPDASAVNNAFGNNNSLGNLANTKLSTQQMMQVFENVSYQSFMQGQSSQAFAEGQEQQKHFKIKKKAQNNG